MRLFEPNTSMPTPALFPAVHPRTTDAVPIDMPDPAPLAEPVQPSSTQFSIRLRSSTLISGPPPLFLAVQLLTMELSPTRMPYPAVPLPSAVQFSRVLPVPDRKSTRLNSSHTVISYAVFCL